MYKDADEKQQPMHSKQVLSAGQMPSGHIPDSSQISTQALLWYHQ
jgi:hypothetical protein